MKKRIVSLFLCAALALPLGCFPARAAGVADVPQREKAAVLKELEVMVGDETGALHLERGVTRAEFTKLLIAASPYRDAVGESANTSPYPDVSYRDWYAPYVRAAVDAALVKGDEQGWFHPQATITLQEGATMAVRLLGYQDSDFPAPWPAGQLALYHSLDLDQGVAAQSGTNLLTRGDCLHLFYDLLCAPTKTGTSYVNLLGHTLNDEGVVDVPALFQVEQEGPIPLTGAWESLLPFAPADALIYRDGERAELSELREYDLLYWAKDQAILFATGNSQSAMGQLTAAVDGPVVAQGSAWKNSIPFALTSDTPVTRNGARAAVSDIRDLDVIYWSEYAQALYVYAKTVTGTVEAVTPSLAAPTAVTIAGVSYPLETFEAQYAFSDLGSFRKGDAVKLLLGRTGGVAAARSLGEEETVTQVGVVAALESRTYTDNDEDAYAARVIVLTAADGQRYAYPYPWQDADDFEPGELVEVTVSSRQTQVRRLSRASLRGTVNAQATALGDLPLSPDVEILDTYGKTATKSVYPSRLAGVTLSSDMVRCYRTDDTGAITALILNDVTGDLHSYGVLTDLETYNSAMFLQSVLTLDLGGQQQVLSVNGMGFPAQKGPVCVMMDGQELKNVRSLTKVDQVTLDGQAAVDGSDRYPLADNVAYYIYDRNAGSASSAYTLASRTQVLAEGYTLSAWYDTPPSQGGRVRVVLAQK